MANMKRKPTHHWQLVNVHTDGTLFPDTVPAAGYEPDWSPEYRLEYKSSIFGAYVQVYIAALTKQEVREKLKEAKASAAMLLSLFP